VQTRRWGEGWRYDMVKRVGYRLGGGILGKTRR